MFRNTIGDLSARARARAHGPGSSELATGLAEMGYSYRLAWYVSATLYGTGGLLVVVFYSLDPALLPRSNFYLGLIAIAIAALCVACGRVLSESNGHQEWMTHARLAAGFAIYVTAAISLGGKFDAYGLFPLLTVLAPAFLYTWRLALPYLLVAVSSGCAGLVLSHGVAQGAHVIITTFALSTATAAVLVAKERARQISLNNRRLAHTDPLTGVANMRGLRERVASEPGHAEDGQPYALFAVDLDDFKEVNDRFDHSMGDEVLRAVASELRMQLDPADLVVRRGGDEFAVFVPVAAERDLEALANTLRRSIAEARREVCPGVSPSGGVAYAVARPGEAVGDTLERADDALHLAKAAARSNDHRAGRGAQRSRLALLRAETQGGRDTVNGGRDGRRESGRPDSLIAGVRRTFSRPNPVWGYAAVIVLLSATALAGVALGGLVEPLGAPAGGAIALGMVLLGAFCLWADRAGVSVKFLPAPWTGFFCLICTAIALAGSSGTALLDLLVVFALYGSFMFRGRTAAGYLALSAAGYATFALAGGYALGLLRTVVAIVVLIIVGGLGARLRQMTVHLARKNLELSELDALTGVANLRGLRGRLAAAAELASQGQCHPVVIAVDLDGFKQVNDTHSHSTGDRMLSAVARAISECVCEEALVARRGGDEFLVVLDDPEPGYADRLVGKLERDIAAARARLCPDLCATASVAAVACRPGASSSELLRVADVALHQRKGRSRPSAPGARPLHLVDELLDRVTPPGSTQSAAPSDPQQPRRATA